MNPFAALRRSRSTTRHAAAILDGRPAGADRVARPAEYLDPHARGNSAHAASCGYRLQAAAHRVGVSSRFEPAQHRD